MKRIGVLIPAIAERMQHELLNGIHRTASAAGYDVVVLTTATSGLDYHIQSDMMEDEENLFTLLDQIRIDGVLLASQYFCKDALRSMICEKIRGAAIPCVDLGGSELGFETVSIPQDEAFYALTTHVIERHHCRNLLFLAGQPQQPDSEQRMRGFLRAAEEYSCPHEIVYGDFWKLRAAQLGMELIEGKRSMPDAILCASDVMAVSLCDTLKKGGISVPDDVVLTGFDGNISAMSNFPSITTVSGGMEALGRTGAAKLIEKIGGTAPLPADHGMRILYGASCGCVERMEDYRTAALQVQAHIRHEEKNAERLEMCINADIITKTSCVRSLEELTALIDQSAYIIKDYRSLHLCLCADWEGDPAHPESCRANGYSRQMLCVISKPFDGPGHGMEKFATKQILPLLSKPHEPVLLFLLPLHASREVFGYCAFVYERASDFTISVMLVNLLSAVASGLRMLRHERYAAGLQKQIEEASLYDKMTDMLSKKGLLLYLEQQETPKGILLVTIAKLSAAGFGQNHSRMPDAVMQSELLLANAIRLLMGQSLQAARLDKRTFAVVFPLTDGQTPEQFADELMIQLEVLIRKMQESSVAEFLPEPYCICGICKPPVGDSLSALWKQLSSTLPKESEFIGISQLRKLRREIHKAPELDWSLSEIAGRLHISKSYVQKLYKKHFGISYMDDLIEARIAVAKQLLVTTDLHIHEVAAACGYQNPTHFMRQFKKIAGVTPSEFRSKQR